VASQRKRKHLYEYARAAGTWISHLASLLRKNTLVGASGALRVHLSRRQRICPSSIKSRAGGGEWMRWAGRVTRIHSVGTGTPSTWGTHRTVLPTRTQFSAHFSCALLCTEDSSITKARWSLYVPSPLNSVALSPQAIYRLSDRHLLAKFSANFCG
jgi:hypothetical protein